MNSIFKQKLRDELDFQDIPAKELAVKTQISQRTIEGYLSTRASIPPADIAVKIAKVLNVTVEYLVTGEDLHTEKDQFLTNAQFSERFQNFQANHENCFWKWHRQ